ncbi:MAG: hypothetical protein ABIT08_04350 [Bacteroidia bacterium]
MFHIGQEVVCVKGHITPDKKTSLLVNKICVIQGINGCRCNTLLNVGLTISNYTRCYKCNYDLPNDGIWWLYADRFVPLDEIGKEEISELIKESERELK